MRGVEEMMELEELSTHVGESCPSPDRRVSPCFQCRHVGGGKSIDAHLCTWQHQLDAKGQLWVASRYLDTPLSTILMHLAAGKERRRATSPAGLCESAAPVSSSIR